MMIYGHDHDQETPKNMLDMISVAHSRGPSLFITFYIPAREWRGSVSKEIRRDIPHGSVAGQSLIPIGGVSEH